MTILAMVSNTEASLAEALCEAEAAFARRNPASLALHGEAARWMPGGNTRTALHLQPFPLYVTSSTGCRIQDADGHVFLDVLGEYTAGLYGHSDPVIGAAITETAARGASNGAPGEGEIRLSRLMCDRFPSVEQIRFCNSGTEATLYAISLARLATGRSRMIAFSGAYHGGVFAFPKEGGPINAPYDWSIARYNDAPGAAALIAAIGDELAAVVVEPMMSNGGCLPANPAFLRILREACDAVGAVLIFDEIVTSRMGAGGAQGRLGLTADLTTFGKYLGAGFSFGAFGGRADLMDLMNPSNPASVGHAGTFNNNVYSMSVGASALEQVFTPARAERLFEDGERLRARLNAIAREITPAAQFTGWGSIMNVHFRRAPISSPDDLADAPKGLTRLFHFDLLEAGVYAAARGQINLSLPMGEAELDQIAAAVGGALERRSDLIEAVCP